MDKTHEIKQLVAQLNQYRHEYYNLATPSVSDATYDALYDQLLALERETGCVMANSPTQTVGYAPVSALEKVTHPTPLLSLDKTKLVDEIQGFPSGRASMLMLKLDGLTIELDYENGKLVQASTRGNGIEGEVVTHNARTFTNIPLEISYKGKLRITGEAYIKESDFQQLQMELLDSSGKPYKNARNLAAGSVRSLDPGECKQRRISFAPFAVLEGLENMDFTDSKHIKLVELESLGFETCYRVYLPAAVSRNTIKEAITMLREYAERNGIPIDGLVMTYDEIRYSAACGRTGHHYKDGLALKFEDELYETVLKAIEWNPTRLGDICPVAVFEPVEIDGCEVSRATLHNVSFIKGLDLCVGNRIMVCKGNMIIPHVEENLDRGGGIDPLPDICPCCGAATSLRRSGKDQIETLSCDNPDCAAKRLQQFVHFVERPAANIEGLSEATLARFIERGWIQSFPDIYRLDAHREEIVQMDGFGEKSFARLWAAIERSRRITFERFLIAMDIPKIGKTASRLIAAEFGGDIDRFEQAISEGYDFTQLADFGATLHNNITQWFQDGANIKLWKDMKNTMNIEKASTPAPAEAAENPFFGKLVVATGALQEFTRDGINMKLLSLGAKPGSAVSKNTDYLIAGEKAGSKLAKARELGIPVLTETEFCAMIGA